MTEIEVLKAEPAVVVIVLGLMVRVFAAPATSVSVPQFVPPMPEGWTRITFNPGIDFDEDAE